MKLWQAKCLLDGLPALLPSPRKTLALFLTHLVLSYTLAPGVVCNATG